MNYEKVLIIGDKQSLITQAIAFLLQEYGVEIVWHKTEAKSTGIRAVIVINQQTIKLQFMPSVEKVILINSSISAKSAGANNTLQVYKIAIEDLKTTKQMSVAYKRFLFVKGFYKPLNDLVLDILSNKINYLAQGQTKIKFMHKISDYKDQTFSFETIQESYKWLNYKNETSKQIKFIEYIKPNIFNDSDNEIRYLTGKIRAYRSGRKIDEILVCTEQEFNEIKRKYFFKEYLKSLDSKYNYHLYYLNKDILNKHKSLAKQIGYGVIIYDDCVYFDYENNPKALGYVDTKEKTMDKMKEIFKKLKNMAIKVKK